MELRPCVECGRHVAVDEQACPFCGKALELAASRKLHFGRLSRAAVFAGAAVAATACGGKKVKPQTTDQQQAGTADAAVVAPPPPDDKNNVPMPYGAPPARRRVV